MQTHVLGFIDRLRRDGVRISVAEAVDALAAVAVVGVERPLLREALAATVVKDERDRAAFDQRFEEWFPRVASETVGTGRRRRGGAGASPSIGGSGGAGGEASGRGRTDAARTDEPTALARGASTAAKVVDQTSAPPRSDARGASTVPTSPGRSERTPPRAMPARDAAERELAQRSLTELTAHDVPAVRVLVEHLGRQLSTRRTRREQRARRGVLDVRRMLRHALATGGVPLVRAYRRRRPRRYDLLALCDASGSVASASDVLLGLLAPAGDYFTRVDCFLYVDRLCAVGFERGFVVPASKLDLYARSDFGRVLEELWREHRALLSSQTIVVILGDARNNRRPPRPDLLRALRSRVRALHWVNPETPARWNTGDSVLRLYAPSCDAVLPGNTIAELAAAVRQLA